MTQIQIGSTTTSISSVVDGRVARWIDGELNTDKLSCESLVDVERMVRYAHKIDGLELPKNLPLMVMKLGREINV